MIEVDEHRERIAALLAERREWRRRGAVGPMREAGEALAATLRAAAGVEVIRVRRDGELELVSLDAALALTVAFATGDRGRR